MRRYEIHIARRMSPGGQGGSSAPAVRVAEASVALSIAVMLLAVSVVFGFKEEISRKIQGFNAHITLYPDAGESGASATLRPGQGLGRLLDSLPYVSHWEETVNTLALLKTRDSFKGVYLTGLSPRADTSFFAETLAEGRLPDFRRPDADGEALLISRKTADQLSLSAGDSVSVYSIGAQVTLRRMAVAGVYDSHFDMFDDKLAFAPLSTAAALGGYAPGQATRIDITTPALSRTGEYTAMLASDLQNASDRGLEVPQMTVENIFTQCAGIFGWLGLLDTNVWVILALLTLVSAFTLISGMLIIILEKVRFIGVMKALGASSASIRHIFVWLAMRIGLRGMAAGTLLALALISVQYWLHVVPLDADAYYMDYAPVAYCWWAFAAVEGLFAVIIYIVLALPSRLVSRISPSESMRFEG